MMKPRRAPAAPLSRGVIAICLGGWSALALEDSDSEAFDLFETNLAGVAHLWRLHEAFLLSEAARRGITPAWRPDRT
ncbi:MAG: hypothetical protein ABJA98_22100 [Acidobacteriota bacterium]